MSLATPRKVFHLIETMRVYRHPGDEPTGYWVEESKTIAIRYDHEVDDRFLDMKLGETRKIARGYELMRVE